MCYCSDKCSKMFMNPHACTQENTFLNPLMSKLSGSIFVPLSPWHISHSGKLLIEITRSSALWCFRTPWCPAGHLCLLHTKTPSSAPPCWEIIFQQVSLFILSDRHIASCVNRCVERWLKNKTYDVQRLLMLYGASHFISNAINFSKQ